MVMGGGEGLGLKIKIRDVVRGVDERAYGTGEKC